MRRSQSGPTKSTRFRVRKRCYVFSYPRDTTGRVCRLFVANRDRARPIVFLAPLRVLVGRARPVAAPSPTQAHKV